jgi:hypothetical protein
MLPLEVPWLAHQALAKQAAEPRQSQTDRSDYLGASQAMHMDLASFINLNSKSAQG